MQDYKIGCNQVSNVSLPLDLLIQELNTCERNSFLAFWISPPNGTSYSGNVVHHAECSRPVNVLLDEVLSIFRLPPDPRTIEFFRIENFSNQLSSLEKYGELLLVS